MASDSILEKIYKSGLKLLVPLTSEETYKIIVTEAIKLVDGEYGSLTLEVNGFFMPVYSTLPLNIKRRRRGFAYKAFKNNEAYVVRSDEFRKIYPGHYEIGIRSLIFVPISYRKKPLGVLIINSPREENLTSRTLEILQLFGSMASLAIRKTQLYDETRKALELRDEFLSMVSHELKTPLTTIHGYAQLLNLKLKPEDLSNESKWIKELSFETTRLTRLVNEIVEINRMRTGRVQYELMECSFKGILEKVLESFKKEWPEYRFEYKNGITDSQDRIIGDPNKLNNVISNVLENAVKYSSSRIPIKIVLKSGAHNITLDIKDKGRGIKEEDLSRIFEGFYRGNNNTKESIGLGLYLVKNIVEMHQGTIEIKSKENKGTNVEIKLPRIKI